MALSRRFQVIVLSLFSLAVAVYFLRLDAVAGNWRDDGWYIILAKGLATGHGFRLICTPRPVTYFYPPVFPALLAAVFRVFPEFPANLWLLKSVSIGAVFSCATLVYFYCRQREYSQTLSLLVAALTLFSPIMVFIATSSVLSEPVFCMFVFGSLLAVERWTKTRSDSWLYAAALLSTLAFLSRAQGITLIVAILVWCLWRRQKKQAFIFAAVVLTLAMPWFVHRHIERDIPGLLPGYGTQFWDRLASSDEKVTWRALPARTFQNTSAILGANVGAMFIPSIYRSANESGSEVLNVTTAPLSRDFIGAGLGSMGSAWQTKLISIALSLIALLGFVQIVRTRPCVAELFFLMFCGSAVIWPWAAFRLIFPLYPLFCLYLVAGIRWIASKLRGINADSESPARIILATILGLFLMDHALYIAQTRGLAGTRVTPEFTRHFEQVKAASEWVKGHTPESGEVTGSNLPQLYLYSGRQVDYCQNKACAAAGIHFWVYETSTRDYPASDVLYDPGGGVVVLNSDPSAVR